jgi:hypothetical protein
LRKKRVREKLKRIRDKDDERSQVRNENRRVKRKKRDMLNSRKKHDLERFQLDEFTEDEVFDNILEENCVFSDYFDTENEDYFCFQKAIEKFEMKQKEK